MPWTQGLVPVQAVAARKELAAQRADERASKLRSEAAALLERSKTHVITSDRKRQDEPRK